MHLVTIKILVDPQSFSLEKSTGKKCFTIAARNLAITWGDTPKYWAWHSVPESRSLSHIPYLSDFLIFVGGVCEIKTLVG